MRQFSTTAVLLLTPGAASAEGKMPQMDFTTPLTTDQVVWMVVILVVLYLALSRWGLPKIGTVLAHRAGVIEADLAAARAAKTAADAAVRTLNAALAEARRTAQAEIAQAVATAKAQAAANAARLNAALDAKLEAAEADIARARGEALNAIKPVAQSTTAAMMQSLTGQQPAPDQTADQVDAAMNKAA
jgi:F-type H+-transporting ATPase subunit b